MKTLKPYRVKSAYSVYRKGDIIYPTGMLRDELIMCGRIEPVPEPEPEPAPVEEPEAEPIDDISDDDDDVLVESAVTTTSLTGTMPRGRRVRR
jgi:hypothetical protein